MKNPLGNKLYYSISEVAEIADLQPYTLRAWEKEFSCLRPRRARGKNRAYRERDIGIILLIKQLLYEERYTTQGVKQKLKNEPNLLQQAASNIALLLERRNSEEEREEETANTEPESIEKVEIVDTGASAGDRREEAAAGTVADTEKIHESRAELEALIEGAKKELNEILKLL